MRKAFWIGLLVILSLSAQGPVSRSVSGCASAGGQTTAYTCSYTVAPGASYVTHQAYYVTATAANTGAVTWNINTIGVKSVVKTAGGAGTALVANDIRAGSELILIYDGTNLQCAVGCGGNAGNAGASGYSTIQNNTSALTARSTANLVGMFFSSSADNSGASATDIRYCDPLVMVCLKDDFMFGSRGSVYGELSWFSGGLANTFTSANLISGRPGVIKCATTNSSASNFCYLSTSGAANPIEFDVSAQLFDSHYYAQITSTTTIANRFGYYNGFTSGLTTSNGCYFESESGTWHYVCKKATTATDNSCAISTDSSWHNFRIWATVAGTINFSIDGVSCGTAISTNVPVTGVGPFWGFINTTTVAETAQVDYFDLVITGLTR